jgi:hypothetical protein
VVGRAVRCPGCDPSIGRAADDRPAAGRVRPRSSAVGRQALKGQPQEPDGDRRLGPGRIALTGPGGMAVRRRQGRPPRDCHEQGRIRLCWLVTLLLEHATLRGCAECLAAFLCRRCRLRVRIQLRPGRHFMGQSFVVMMEMTMPCMIHARKTGVGHAHSHHQQPDEKRRCDRQSGCATVETKRHGGGWTAHWPQCPLHCTNQDSRCL